MEGSNNNNVATPGGIDNQSSNKSQKSGNSRKGD